MTRIIGSSGNDGKHSLNRFIAAHENTYFERGLISISMEGGMQRHESY